MPYQHIGPWEIWKLLYRCIFQTHFTNWYLDHFLWNGSQANATVPFWWEVRQPAFNQTNRDNLLVLLNFCQTKTEDRCLMRWLLKLLTFTHLRKAAYCWLSLHSGCSSAAAAPAGALLLLSSTYRLCSTSGRQNGRSVTTIFQDLQQWRGWWQLRHGENVSLLDSIFYTNLSHSQGWC